jgi:hypothetical protein
VPVEATSRETDEVGWFSLDEILSGRIPLYPGTKKFFDRYVLEFR